MYPRDKPHCAESLSSPLRLCCWCCQGPFLIGRNSLLRKSSVLLKTSPKYILVYICPEVYAILVLGIFFFPHSRRDLSFQTNRLLIVYTHIFVPKTPRHVRILLTYSLIYSFLTRAQKIPKSRYYKLQSKIQYLNPNYIE